MIRPATAIWIIDIILLLAGVVLSAAAANPRAMCFSFASRFANLTRR